MRTHPVFLCLEGRPCLVIGGDAPAAAKVEACLLAGALVTIVAPTLSDPVAAFTADPRVRHLARDYRTADLDGMALAYSVTRDADLIARLTADAAAARVLLNVVDMPDACTFIAPAVVRRGELQVAVATGGASPALSARMRRQFEDVVGPEYEPFVAILRAVRTAMNGNPTRAEVLTRLLDSDLLACVRRGDAEGAGAILREVVGRDCTLERLGVALGVGGR